MECGATVHTGGLPGGQQRRTASILAGIAAGLLCGVAQAQEVKTLRWTPPTERADGTALSADELAAHRVLCEPGVDVSVPMPATTWAGVEPGIESCVVRAVDQDGLESADSARVFPAWDPDPDPEPDPPGAPTDVRVVAVELPPSTGPTGDGVVAYQVYIDGSGSVDGGTYTTGASETPVGQDFTFSGSLDTSPGSEWDALPEPRAVFNLGANWHNLLETTLTTPVDIGLAGRLLFVFVPQSTVPPDPQFKMGNSGGDAFFQITRNATDLRFWINWNGGNSINEADMGTPGTVPVAVEVILDLSNATAAERVRWRRWNLGDAPGEFNDSTYSFGVAATSGNSGFDSLDILGFGEQNNGSPGFEFGLAVLDDDPDTDLSALVAPSSGTTVEASLSTPAAALAGFDSRVIARGGVTAAASAGETHGASSTIRAAITAGATAQEVAGGVASMAAQLAAAAHAGAEATARATMAATITESAGAGEAVSRQGAVLDQMVAAAEADALLSAYLQAVAALAAGVEAGDAWAARLTAAATLSGAAEAGAEFSEDSVALIAEQSEAGAQFAAAVHSLAEQLEEATAGAAMAGVVSTLAAFSSASSAGAVFESAMRHADALQSGAEAGASFAGVTGELTGLLLESVSAAMVVSSAHQARATWSATAHAGASFVASGDVSALIGALAFVVAAEQRVFTVPAETRTFIVS